MHKVQYIRLVLYFSMVVLPRDCVYCEWHVYSLEMGYPSSTNMYICECQINSGLLFALLLSHWGQSFFACPCSAAMQLCVRQCKAPKQTCLKCYLNVSWPNVVLHQKWIWMLDKTNSHIWLRPVHISCRSLESQFISHMQQATRESIFAVKHIFIMGQYYCPMVNIHVIMLALS